MALLLSLPLASLAEPVQVTLPYYEHFDYPTGSSLDAPFIGTAFTVTVPSGVGEPEILNGSLDHEMRTDASGHRLQLNSAGSEELGIDLKTSVSAVGGPLYAAFLVRFTSMPGVGGDFFAHFTEGNLPSGTTFRARIHARANGAGGIELGIRATSSDKAHYVSARPLSLNSTHLVVAKISFGSGWSDDKVELFIDPPAGSEPVADATARAGLDFGPIGRFALQQSSEAGTIELDELYLGNSWDAVVNPSLAPIEGLSKQVFASPMIDGMITEYGAGLAFQTVNTNFGTTSNQLNGLYVGNDSKYLYIGTTGLVTSNNIWWWFIDTPGASPGVANLANPAGGLIKEFLALGTSMGSLRLPAGFAADYAITWQLNSSACMNRPYLNDLNALTGEGKGTCVKSGTVKYTDDWEAGYDYSLNGGGQVKVAAKQGTSAGSSAQLTTSGVELKIPLTELGLSPGQPFKMFAAITGGGGTALTFSNQFLPGLPVGAGRVNGGSVSLTNPPSLAGLGARYINVTLAGGSEARAYGNELVGRSDRLVAGTTADQ